ncbi:PHP domain-containing protein [Microaceticoccus formicicus]|uniref:PHP domain-containing protein n=1 Tax=Microaceticoccus formicicus TaxID=3118105 RepID=UPI003CD015E9|nr:PHP domain-containing protein [Peptoniphilaceae bacterium AMB_02]
MKVLSDNHMHTEYSRNGHAKGTIREVVMAARNKGLKQILITDHGPGHIAFGVRRDKFKEIREEIDRLNEEFDDINILMGCESNVTSFNGEIDLRDEEIAMLDRVSVGFHYGIIPDDFYSFWVFFILNPISKILRFLKPLVAKHSTKCLINIVNKYPIYIITHPGSKINVDTEKLARACEEKGTALEINSSHSCLTEEGIIEALKTNVMFSIGSDAHRPENVGDLTNALERIKNTGVPKDRIINIVE